MAFQRSEWNQLISEVNNVRASPPAETDCDPLPPISELAPNTIWRRSHIAQLRQALAETCASIGFGPVPNIWSATILTEIRSQIGKAWCDCDDEEDDGCPEGVDPTVENGLIFELFTQGLEIFANCFGRRPAPTTIDPQSLVDGIQLQEGFDDRAFAIVAEPVNPGQFGSPDSYSPAGGTVDCKGKLTVSRNTTPITDATGTVVFCANCDADCEQHIEELEAELNPATDPHIVKYHIVIFATSARCCPPV